MWSRDNANFNSIFFIWLKKPNHAIYSIIYHEKIQSFLHYENLIDFTLQMEWSGSSRTMDEVLARMKQREEASVKRERAMAYAFSHQVNSNQIHVSLIMPRQQIK